MVALAYDVLDIAIYKWCRAVTQFSSCMVALADDIIDIAIYKWCRAVTVYYYYYYYYYKHFNVQQCQSAYVN